ncbi:MAG: hypothetical protein LBE53_00710 [Paucimonas sp.]|jgi:hypothetical protein|uniref:hypothetical protein n=1 Tax=Pantoea sp. Cy-639 TaxID=2608360 RepID=UPI00141DB095|nr:hypothetical protein [Pantoea sp. Cy-639]MDR2305715.1 hypothetical protein [Paucimonas sp.]NIF19376.1 hypothetical protein [Pantoea sp. Cy-639]
MKLHQLLSVNGVGYDLVKADVRLELRNPGRATFTVQAETALKGLVTLDIGYNDSPLQRHFIGYVERCTAANSKQQVLFCRELAAILGKPLPMNLRHVDLRGVLAQVAQHTGLRFRVPERPYAATRAPFFYSLGTGVQVMESLAEVFAIEDFVWQQQGNGEVYVGSWADSYFAARTALQLPVELFDHYQGNRSASIAALPGLRPGAMINQGERVTHVALADNQMAIRWKTQSAAP